MALYEPFDWTCRDDRSRPRVMPLPEVTVYTVPHCFDCAAVKHLLKEAGIPFREIDISQIPKSREALEMLSGLKSVPQVFAGSRFLGQVAEIRYLIQTGKIRKFIDPPGTN